MSPASPRSPPHRTPPHAAFFRRSFFVAHFIKDLGIALAEAKRMGAWSLWRVQMPRRGRG
jgi:3-hydroxyisobutyrate dehydrogenase-like beta-hydroxyacid dehydrogenase